MKKLIAAAAMLGVVLAVPGIAQSTPEADQKAFQAYYKKMFPDVPFEDFANGVYSIDPVARANWEAIEEFPPYEPAISEGEKVWNKPFANGKGFKDCFPDGPAMEGKYPHWDKQRGMVVTLELAVQECLKANGEEQYKPFKGKLANLLAYIAFKSRGQIINVEIPKDDPKAIAAYESGKRFYLTKRGQLNFSCADCHLNNPSRAVRTEILSPALGHPTHWPVYRAKWGEMGTLTRRFKGCNEQVRAEGFDPLGEEYRNLEFFLTYMSNGLPLNGPGARK